VEDLIRIEIEIEIESVRVYGRFLHILDGSRLPGKAEGSAVVGNNRGLRKGMLNFHALVCAE